MTKTTNVPFKLFLQRHRESTFHRFSGAYTLQEFQSVVHHLWGGGPKAILLEYEDDEGDRIRVGSQMEWTECLRLWEEQQTAKPVRIFARRPRKEDKDKEKDKKDSSPLFERTIQTEPPAAKSEVPQLPPINIPSQPLHVDPTPAADVEEEQESEVVEVTPVVTFEVPEHSAVMDLLSLLYNCHAADKLMTGEVDLFGTTLTRSVNPQDPSEVHLDIDRQALYHRAVQQANLALDEKRHEAAEKILRVALVLYKDNMLLEYNLSCALSLQGLLDDAFGMLSLAMEHGYDNLEHIKADPDLEALRGHPSFAAVFHEPPKPVDVTSPASTANREAPPSKTVRFEQQEEKKEEVEPEKKPEAPKDPALDVPPPVRTLMSIFPYLTPQEAAAALLRAGGNVSIAVNNLLSQA